MPQPIRPTTSEAIDIISDQILDIVGDKKYNGGQALGGLLLALCSYIEASKEREPVLRGSQALNELQGRALAIYKSIAESGL